MAFGKVPLAEGFAVWRGPLVSGHSRTEAFSFRIEVSRSQCTPSPRRLEDVLPVLNNPLPQAAATLGRRRWPSLPQRMRWDLAGKPLSRSAGIRSRRCSSSETVRTSGAGIADPWALSSTPAGRGLWEGRSQFRIPKAKCAQKMLGIHSCVGNVRVCVSPCKQI